MHFHQISELEKYFKILLMEKKIDTHLKFSAHNQ